MRGGGNEQIQFVADGGFYMELILVIAAIALIAIICFLSEKIKFDCKTCEKKQGIGHRLKIVDGFSCYQCRKIYSNAIGKSLPISDEKFAQVTSHEIKEVLESKKTTSEQIDKVIEDTTQRGKDANTHSSTSKNNDKADIEVETSEKVCKSCSKTLGFFSGKWEIADGRICGDCMSKAGYEGTEEDFASGKSMERYFEETETLLKSMTASDIKEMIIEKNKSAIDIEKRAASFAATQGFGGFASVFSMASKIEFDDKTKLWRVPNHSKDKVYSYSEILKFELLEDGSSTLEGGLGMALVGGVLFGGVGAVVGSNVGKTSNPVCNSLQIKITLNNMRTPMIVVSFISSPTDRNSKEYKAIFADAHECISKLHVICEAQNSVIESETKNVPQIPPQSNADELRKYKGLLDDGIISQDEFDAKKKQLLGL